MAARLPRQEGTRNRSPLRACSFLIFAWEFRALLLDSPGLLPLKCLHVFLLIAAFQAHKQNTTRNSKSISLLNSLLLSLNSTGCSIMIHFEKRKQLRKVTTPAKTLDSTHPVPLCGNIWSVFMGTSLVPLVYESQLSKTQ